MCSIGWIKEKEGYLLFKNRDRKKQEPKENFLVKDDALVGFSDKKIKGLWAGVNKYGLGIVVAYGPIRKVLEGYQPESFDIVEDVLRNSKSAEDATKRFIYLIGKKKVGRSFNVIIADFKQANSVEILPNNFHVEKLERFYAKANSFTILKRYNYDPEIARKSKLRVRKIASFMPLIEKAEDLTKMLRYHSEEDADENICRHDESTTVASAIFEVKKAGIKVDFVLNASPCKKAFEEKVVRF